MASKRWAFRSSIKASDLTFYRTLSGRAANFAALLSLSVVILAACGFFGMTESIADGQMPRETLTIQSGEKTHTFEVEVARLPQEKSRGLMYRTELPVGTGMLFPYEEPTEIQMWMRNTYISLDMVFIRADGRVHRIAAYTEPMSDDIVSSHGDATGVLEIGGGEASRLGIKAGDLVRHAHFGTASSR
ncbi:conserved exported protein of unknown function [Candidatus Filomicrobium marinum]|uniref:Uncharacterized protein n=1 Tax=Candidatus Filomicrobium marinum TaxID=1608628 RepID=A0A0D6JBA3_9HYPH|nr:MULTISPECIES: DUF192 domain-containing protein [Filomicrobium]CFX04266.1 conserved exported protein of unknown function [Candidatus Filomicrobium marinum]CPR16012.1 conserved exported protein of unknown function [Candidatus Filomicrobium marinum]